MVTVVIVSFLHLLPTLVQFSLNVLSSLIGHLLVSIDPLLFSGKEFLVVHAHTPFIEWGIWNMIWRYRSHMDCLLRLYESVAIWRLSVVVPCQIQLIRHRQTSIFCSLRLGIAKYQRQIWLRTLWSIAFGFFMVLWPATARSFHYRRERAMAWQNPSKYIRCPPFCAEFHQIATLLLST